MTHLTDQQEIAELRKANVRLNGRLTEVQDDLQRAEADRDKLKELLREAIIYAGSSLKSEEFVNEIRTALSTGDAKENS